MSDATLRARYDAENVTEQVLDGAEGEQYTATVVYPDDPARRLEIVWADEAKTSAAAVSTSEPESAWIGPGGLSMGAPLTDVEAVNGRPFRLWGFAWDYGGTVADWNGGAFAPSNGCLTRVRFNEGGDVESAVGDREFSSDSPEVRRAAPYVAEIAIVYEMAE